MEYGEQLLKIEQSLDDQADIMRDQVVERDNGDKLLERLETRVAKIRKAIDHAYDDPLEETVSIATDMVEMFKTLSIEQLFSIMRKDNRDHYKQRATEHEKAARTDSLTQSNNRSVYHEQIKAATNKIASNDDKADGQKHYFALVMFDLDRFKGINDDYGHDVGDAALQAFASILKNITRTAPDRRTDEARPNALDRRLEPEDTDDLFEPYGHTGQHGGEKSMSRLGGDEFTLLMNTQADSPEKAAQQFQAGLERIKAELEVASFHYNDMTFPLVSSAGMHILSADDTVDSAYVGADTALAEHKKSKKERYEQTVQTLRDLDVPNLQVVEDKRKTELSAMKVEDVVIALNTLQERGALIVHVRPDQQLTPAAEILEELGVTISYEDDYYDHLAEDESIHVLHDDDPDSPVIADENTPI